MNEKRIIALAGNPNVGKSTVFNALTGLRQHTGNWPGKTVAAVSGVCRQGGEEITLLDVPGAYSLRAHSAEEEAALEALCFGGAGAVIVVCDAGCLERNLNLVYQVLEITGRAVLALNMMDEAEKQGLSIDPAALSRRLGIPVVPVCAREGRGLDSLLATARQAMDGPDTPKYLPLPPAVERAAVECAETLAPLLGGVISPRFAALRLMEKDECFLRELNKRVSLPEEAFAAAERALARVSLAPEGLSTLLTEGAYRAAETACREAVQGRAAGERQLRADRLLTGPGGVPALLLLLALVFFITLKGADRPSAWLAAGFEELEGLLGRGLAALGSPPFLSALLTEGVFRTVGQVVAVMLPPMAIFFPLFTLLEDAGYLPRVAFLLDGVFARHGACGKQALTICMGFGCNAVGVMGCRIIDSPRERLIAMLTNCFTPCNGRFPTLFLMLTLLFSGAGLGGAALSAGLLTGLAALSLGMTLLCSRLLSHTVLRGVPSSYTLELPPFRMPQVGKVLVRSALDRTLFVLGRAVVTAAPAGLVIFLLAHIQAGGETLLARFTGLLDPLGRLMGLDGVILAGFFLGMPANEIVLPIILMAYGAGGGLPAAGVYAGLGETLRAQGWTALTALNLMLFSLFHFPCATTLLTFYRETKSKKWTLLCFLLPLAAGCGLCALTAAVGELLSGT